MITGGIDVGIENVKAVVMKDGKVLGMELASTGSERSQAADKVWQDVLKKTHVNAADVNKVVATGLGRWDVGFAEDDIVETVADTRAVHWLFPQARSVIDVGADKSRAVRFDSEGKIIQFYLAQKCSLGLGLLIGSVARMLGISLDEMSRLSAPRNGFSANDRCGGFAELDAVLAIHDNIPKNIIGQAVHDAVATKLSSMVNEVTLDKEIAVIGGVARNQGVVNALKRVMGVNLLVPENPEFAGALGAALVAAG